MKLITSSFLSQSMILSFPDGTLAKINSGRALRRVLSEETLTYRRVAAHVRSRLGLDAAGVTAIASVNDHLIRD